MPSHTRMLAVAGAVVATLSGVPAGNACTLAPIRLGAGNAVPPETTPARVAAFIASRTTPRAPQYRNPESVRRVVDLYVWAAACPSRQNGACIPIRWDYAVFQMLHETNYLAFTGGVRPEHNNFAGIGATVPGRPGEVFKDIGAGVMAHVQHLLMYTGVLIDAPVARRTATVQQGVVAKMRALGKPVTMCDVGRGGWSGTDPKVYGAKVQTAACAFDKRYCEQR